MPHRPRQATPSHHLRLRNIYVLPTRAGFMLLATLLLLLVTSINFQLNLGYALTFLITGAAAASVFTAYRTLRNLSLGMRGITPTFAGQNLQFTVVIDNPDKRAHYGIGLAIDVYGLRYEKNEWTWTDIPANETATITLSVMANERGWLGIPQLVILTRFPMGVFRTWSVWQPAAAGLVYPAAEIKAPVLPTNQLHEQSPGQNTAQKWVGDEYDGTRPYQPGDPLKRIVWKKVLASGELVSRQTASFESNELWLSLQSTRLSMLEAQLSRLTTWVLQAHGLGIAYGLQLGNLRIPPATGEAHQLRCLRELALYQRPQTQPNMPNEG